MKSKYVIKFITPLAVLGTIPAVSLLTSCSNSNGIIFANFESYMSPDVINEVQSNAGSPTQFIWYGTNEELQSKFNRYYDIAIPSSYEVIPLMQQGSLLPIDYSQFPSIQELKQDDIIDSLPQPCSGKDLMDIKLKDEPTVGLLTDAVISAIDQIDVWVLAHGGFPTDDPYWPNCSILDYGMPYFLQDWMMVYESDKNDPTPIMDDNADWATIAQTMGNVNNNERADIFKPTNARKISIVDDTRSVYDMCAMVSESGINPNDGTSIDEFENTYNQFFSHFTTRDNFHFNTDSGEILQTIADHAIPNSGIAYNGDILYAANGAGIYDTWDNDTFHAVIPDVTMAALDMVVMNKKDQNNETKLQNMYKAVDIVAINGIGRSEQELTDNDYTAMENFDYVYYTSPLESIDAFVKDDSQDGYFAQDYDYQADADFIAELIRIYTVSDSALLEEPISDLNKSNMHWAYSTIKMYL